ncbi:MAG TPA: carboxypeptidase-like regulatory domain-containing protein [Ilumatobacter sp.]|nr:carboxypeptidase-like regulatory domain-containing protein [Ilumatobacter sp.]
MPAIESAISQTHVAVIPGIETRVEIDITNTSDVIDGVTAIVDGINPDWVRLERPLVSLFPSTTDRLTVIFDIPRSCPAGDYLVVVRVVSTLDADRGSVHDFWLAVGVVEGLDVELRPSIVTGGSSGRIEAIIRNTGNAVAEVSVTALEPTRVVDCRAEPARVVLGHGAEAVLPITMRGPRPWLGQPVARQVHVGVSSGEPPDGIALDKVATFNQKPRIPRGLITVLTLAAIVALWALIFLWVVTELRRDDPATKAVGTDLFTGPANVPIAAIAGEARGTVTAATTGQGVARITVEAWRVKADGTQVAVASAATGDDGTFALPSLIPGQYRLRYSAEGFTETWYLDPDAPVTADPAPGDVIRIEPTKTLTGLDVVVDGARGSLTGAIAVPPGSAGTPLTVTATLITETSGADGDAPPQVFTQTTTDGTINLDGLPTPGTYQVTVTGDGFATQSFQQAVGGGQAAVLNTVTLSAAAGTIGGTVVDGSGAPLGGVAVVARSGDTEVRATTPTSGSVGAFRLVDLPTPGTYVLTFTKDGYSSQTIALDLGAGGTASTSAQLVGGSGTVGGSVVDAAGNPLGGVTVEAVCDGYVGAGATLTTNGPAGAAGSFAVTGLPVPGECTVTFSAPGYQTETYPAAFTTAGLVGVGPVHMLPVQATISGTVRSGGSGLGEVTVTATDGTRSQVTTSATNPAGSYSFADLPAGSYTLTFARQGYTTRVVLVHVAEGDAAVVDASLGARN